MIKSFAFGLLASTCVATAALASAGPTPAPPNAPIPTARDIPFPGVVTLAADATDIRHRIVRVKETIPVTGGQETVLLYPRWLPGVHAPEGPIDRMTGLKITADGRAVAWVRDTADVFAFRLTPPPGAKAIEVSFEYISPVSDKVGPVEFTANMAILEWPSFTLYPAGYFTRQIPVDASLTLPEGWSFATALDKAETQGARTTFRRAALETVGDSPVYAGVNGKVLDVTPPGGGAPVHLNIFADRPENLAMTPAQIEQHRRLVEQMQKLQGSHHYDHYDFLFSLSDTAVQMGLEHHRSSEDGAEADYFTNWDKGVAERDLLAHEYTHSWNGKFRRPYDLWTETYNTPMRDSLLWVYEGQTQYWGNVLTARAGLRNREEALDQLATTAAYYAAMEGREWRNLQDTTNDEIITERRPQSWPSHARFLDYYQEGQLIWLEVDTLIRERSGGKRSLDDFARGFFGIDDGSYVPVTYRFEDVVKALNAVEPYDWTGFLRTRLDQTRPAPLEGLARGGYKLTFDDKPGAYFKSRETLGKLTDLTFSLGLRIGGDGVLRDVFWNGPAFKAGLTAGAKVLAVNGVAFEPDILKDAVTAAKASAAPLELIVQDQTRFRTVTIDWHGGLRYPHLARDPSQPARLDEILAPRK